MLALTHDRPATGPFNICSGDPRTILDMALALRTEGSPMPEVVGDYRLGDIRHVFASPHRAAEELGFVAEIGFDEGLAEFATAPLRSAASTSNTTGTTTGH